VRESRRNIFSWRTEGKRGRESRRHIFRKISWRAEGKRGRESKLYSEKSLGEQKEREGEKVQ
jgi:hypothetical protein